MSDNPVSANSGRLEAAIASLRSLSIETLTGGETSGYAVDGKVPGVVARPTSPQGISEAMSVASEHGLSVSPLGGRTRTGLGNAPESLDLVIDMTGVEQVLAHNAADLTATVEGGHQGLAAPGSLGRARAVPGNRPSPARPRHHRRESGRRVERTGHVAELESARHRHRHEDRAGGWDGHEERRAGRQERQRLRHGADAHRCAGDARHHCGGVVQAHSAPCPAGDSAGGIRFGWELPRCRAGGIREQSRSSGDYDAAWTGGPGRGRRYRRGTTVSCGPSRRTSEERSAADR